MNATNRQLWRLNEEGLLTIALSPAPISRDQAKAALAVALDNQERINNQYAQLMQGWTVEATGAQPPRSDDLSHD